MGKFLEDVEFLKPLEDQEVKKIPGTATFEAEISKSGLKGEWFRNGQPIKSSPKYKISEDLGTHKLIINDVTDDDVDVYSLKIRNAETEAKLKVVIPPHLTTDYEKELT